ncbi:MAG TPA: pectin acetylesterase-family hydrolase [Acidobacteriota bacterium]|nr:pectin acetylesterase-family hydrolase [Acidobacteriota bacterium]
MNYKIVQTLLLVVLAISSAQAAPLQRVEVRDAARRKAVCNDGSPAVYYFRPGSGEGANRWVIFLAGGGFCFSVNTCQLRQILNPELMTSSDKPPTTLVDGLLSDSKAQNPDFYNANHVAIVYCSSDLWSGNNAASGGTGGYAFRGWTILRAVVADLKARTSGPNLKTATEVLFAGTSAGGDGVMVHLDWLASQLRNAKVRGLNDAGWIPESNTVPINPSMNEILDSAVQLWNGKTDASCAQSNPTGKSHCYLSAVYPYLSTPLYVQESQWDSFVLGLAGVDYPFNATGQLIADAYAAAVRSSLGPVAAAFSPRTFSHGLAPYKRFNGQKVNGITLRRTLGNWFFDRPGTIKAIQN